MKLRTALERTHDTQLLGLLELCDTLPAVIGIDHIAFTCSGEALRDFVGFWDSQGFRLRGEWHTIRFPAHHIVLARSTQEDPAEHDLVGVSVHTAHALIGPTQGPETEADFAHLQHIALRVDPNADLAALRLALMATGIQFMTDVLSYTDETGAGLRQTFTAPPADFFVEFVQRFAGSSGEPFGGFAPQVIDEWYEALSRAPSAWAALAPHERAEHLRIIPSRVEVSLRLFSD